MKKLFLKNIFVGFSLLLLAGCSSSNKPEPSSISMPYDNHLNKYTILIDPGHGGKDPGSIGVNGLKEKDVNFSVAVKVKNRLKKMGFNVRMTRWHDKFQSLGTRASYANKHDVDLLVSIHANSVSGKKARYTKGIETFYYRKSITSKVLAQSIQRHLLNEVREVMGKNQIKSRGSKGHGFYVLRKSDMPAALVELGFLSHPVEAQRLKRDSYQQLLANGISLGIAEYFK